MTKTQALIAMANGEKVTHAIFCPDEYIYAKDGQLYDENDTPLDAREFWNARSAPHWDYGWEVIIPAFDDNIPL